jgi:hypothetical protein
VGGATVPLLLATPAFAARGDGEVGGDSISFGTAALIYVGIPIGLFLLITLLTVTPSLLRRPRYRPGRAWNYEPLWFAGPDDPDTALRSARPHATSRGGASAEW